MAATGNEAVILRQLKSLKDWIVAQLSNKANASHTHTYSQVIGLTANKVAVSSSDGKLASSSITSTELGYLDGVDSNVQAQIDALSQKVSNLTTTVSELSGKVVTRSSSDPVFTAADLAACKKSAEGIPYRR